MNFRGEKLFDASFDKFAKTYDDVRPRYPIQLYKDIQRFCDISSQTNLLEIGTGSGIATEEIAKLNPQIITVEPGENLVEVAKQNLSKYRNIQFICDTFENCDFKESQFDIILSATTFHWLEKESKYYDCCKYLKDNGFLVLFWNSFCRENSQIMKEIDEVYARNLSETYEKKSDVNRGVLEKVITREQELIQSEYFYVSALKRYKTEYQYNADSYIALLNTYPKIIKLESEVRDKFLAEIKEVIIKNGNKITIPILTSLYICRKREQFTNDLGCQKANLYSSEKIDMSL